jgi:hypothetical protein
MARKLSAAGPARFEVFDPAIPRNWRLPRGDTDWERWPVPYARRDAGTFVSLTPPTSDGHRRPRLRTRVPSPPSSDVSTTRIELLKHSSTGHEPRITAARKPPWARSSSRSS